MMLTLNNSLFCTSTSSQLPVEEVDLEVCDIPNTPRTLITITYEALYKYNNNYLSEREIDELFRKVGEACGNSGLGVLTVSDIPQYEAMKERVALLSLKEGNHSNVDKGINSYMKRSITPHEKILRNDKAIDSLEAARLCLNFLIDHVGFLLANLCDGFVAQKSPAYYRTMEELVSESVIRMDLMLLSGREMCSRSIAIDEGSHGVIFNAFYTSSCSGTNGCASQDMKEEQCLYSGFEREHEFQVNVPEHHIALHLGDLDATVSDKLLHATQYRVTTRKVSDSLQEKFHLKVQAKWKSDLESSLRNREITFSSPHRIDEGNTTGISEYLPSNPMFSKL